VFNPSGRAIATGGFGGGLTTLWNASTGRPLPPAIPGAGVVYPAGYYDHGRDLAIARDGQVELWDVPTRTLIATLSTPGGMPGAVVAPNGREIVTTSKTGSLTTWPLSLHQWIADACRIANRRLTPTEWQAYLPGLPYQPACRE
jgi:WD40 repeat protein